MNVAVGGPQGVGKSSALRVLAGVRPDFDVVFFGDQMPDDFRDLRPADKQRIRAEVTDRIAARLARRARTTVVDLHYLDLREPDSSIQPADFLDHFDLLVFLLVPPETLLERRLADTSRADRPTTLPELRRDVDAHVASCDRLSSAGLPAVLIDCQGDPIGVAGQLLRHIDAGPSDFGLTLSAPNGIASRHASRGSLPSHIAGPSDVCALPPRHAARGAGGRSQARRHVPGSGMA
ncbi:AAA family ATPase [Micromonospora rubida]|uniref:AAA family ATPase n=1 Tax=Micromonospora rubida TaxID=2697657 RepID=A0ABW7ST05_9ACTN